MANQDPEQDGITSTTVSEQDPGEPGSPEYRGPGVGTRIGRYIVLESLGHGGMGLVYKAYDPELNRQVAIKLLSFTREQSDSARSTRRARLLREAQALAQLSHPNVIAIHDVGTFSDDLYIAMELIEGKTLRAWMEAGQRTLAEKVAVMKAAGLGLAAAHRAGLVHRDFKPENVMIGRDGRIRVLDFGLVRATSQEGSAEAPEGTAGSATGVTRQADSPGAFELTDGKSASADQCPGTGTGDHPGSGQALRTPLTEQGSILGTPTYMAPEQFLGFDVDARTDQFSYSVVLFEILYGARPFQETSRAALRQAVIQGKVREPRGAEVPSWLRKIVLRGLSVAPGDRYPGMDSLLRDLEDDPRLRQRRVLKALGLVLLTGLIVALATFGLTQRSELCQGAEAKLIRVWDEPRKSAVRQAFLATGKSYAPDSWRAVEQAMDAYASLWVALHTRACQATRIQKEQSEELLDLQMICLNRCLKEVGSLSELLASADAQVMEKAVQAVLSLPRLTRCAETDALKEMFVRTRLPQDEASRQKIGDVRAQLGSARALLGTGKIGDSKNLARGALLQARACAYRPVEAEALVLLGSVLEAASEYAKSEQTLSEAYWVAEASGSDEQKARAALELIYVVGYKQSRYAEGMRHGSAAKAILERLGADPELQASWHSNMGVLYDAQGQFETALDQHRQALSIRERLLGPGHLSTATSLNNIGLDYGELADYDRALEYLERALATREKLLGATHPEVARSHNNLGVVLFKKGDLDRALSLYQRALSIREQALGPDHTDVATALFNIGEVLLEKGEVDQALSRFQRALSIEERAFGPAHPDVAATIHVLGEAFHRKGAYTEALEKYGRALPILEKALGTDHPQVAYTECATGDSLSAAGLSGKAEGHYLRALSIWEKALGSEHPDVAHALIGLGHLYRKQGSDARARLHYQRVLGICQAKACVPRYLPESQFGLARLLWRGDEERARALKLAREALAAFQRLRYQAEARTEVERWLSQHVLP